jgi:hypothetical protein
MTGFLLRYLRNGFWRLPSGLPPHLPADPEASNVRIGLGYRIMWKRERDLLIAQTMAFVQSVTGKATDTDGRPEPRLETMPLSEPTTVARPADILPAARLSPTSHSDLRDEIRRRVAAFRARQQVFDRDRDEYCNAMMAKARAATEHAVNASDDQPLKR